MVPIGDDNVVDASLAPNHVAASAVMGGGSTRMLMLTHGEIQPVEVNLLFLREPRPLPNAGRFLTRLMLTGTNCHRHPAGF